MTSNRSAESSPKASRPVRTQVSLCSGSRLCRRMARLPSSESTTRILAIFGSFASVSRRGYFPPVLLRRGYRLRLQNQSKRVLDPTIKYGKNVSKNTETLFTSLGPRSLPLSDWRAVNRQPRSRRRPEFSTEAHEGNTYCMIHRIEGLNSENL